MALTHGSKLLDACFVKNLKFVCSSDHPIMFKILLAAWHKYLLKTYKWYFRLPMSAFATVTQKGLSKLELFRRTFTFKLFHISVAVANIGTWKSKRLFVIPLIDIFAISW